MFIVSNRIEVTENAEEFERGFIEAMRNTLGGVPGLHKATLMRPESEGLPYISTMEFDSKQDFFAWMRSDSFKASHSNADAAGMQAPSNVEQHTLIEEFTA